MNYQSVFESFLGSALFAISIWLVTYFTKYRIIVVNKKRWSKVKTLMPKLVKEILKDE